jgi:hypothetical protein
VQTITTRNTKPLRFNFSCFIVKHIQFLTHKCVSNNGKNSKHFLHVGKKISAPEKTGESASNSPFAGEQAEHFLLSKASCEKQRRLSLRCNTQDSRAQTKSAAPSRHG